MKHPVPYLVFADLVARAVREVRRERDYPEVSVIAYSLDADVVDSSIDLHAPVPWGEFHPPIGPIVLWQRPYELMPDQGNYYRQIKAVLRHEFHHAEGDFGHDDDTLGDIEARAVFGVVPAVVARSEWASMPITITMPE